VIVANNNKIDLGCFVLGLQLLKFLHFFNVFNAIVEACKIVEGEGGFGVELRFKLIVEFV
jgi:hypothetical protein